MFDHDKYKINTWQSSLCRGDIVLFRFPEIKSVTDAPKTRPCLVLEVDSIDGQKIAKLAYGTSARTSANRGYEIWVKRRSSMAVAGLNRLTRFVGARTTTVSLNNPDFELGKQASPIIGHLDDFLCERMHAVRARLQVEHDNYLEVRNERQRRQETAALANRHPVKIVWSKSSEDAV
jgi:hypothetical protein